MSINSLDSILKETATDLNIDFDIVDIVINHKWRTIYENISIQSSVEDSGLGKFRLRPSVINKRIQKLERYINSGKTKLETETNERKIRTINIHISQATSDIEYLKTKLNE